MQITNSPQYLTSPALYFLAPIKYLGDKRSAYGRILTFSLRSSAQEGFLADTLGDIVLQGTALPYSLVMKLTAPPGDGPTSYEVSDKKVKWQNHCLLHTCRPIMGTSSMLCPDSQRSHNKLDSFSVEKIHFHLVQCAVQGSGVTPSYSR